MSENEITRQGIAGNAFGEHYLFAVNRNAFSSTDAATVFRSYYGESLFEEDSFYVIAGTDSGLLHQYIKTHGIPKGSRYLFIELPQILALLEDFSAPEKDLVLSTVDDWLTRAQAMEVKKYAFRGRLTLLRSLGVVHGHYGDYQPFWRSLKEKFDAYVQQVRFSSGTRPFIICQIANLTENQIPAICLQDAFRGKTAVVLAGGPSLDELLPWVRQQRDNLLVIAASRISHSLLNAGIQPDISVSVDPQAFNLYVCKEMFEFQEGTLLVNHYHLSSNLLASWGGQKVFMGNRYPWRTPMQSENITPSGGTTVTNVVLDLAVATGVAQIVLGGVDFCFAQQGHTHASGTVEYKMGSRPQLCEVQVETNGGKMADTDIGYRESGWHIDRQAQYALTKGCRMINPAAGAMRLDHVDHLSVNDIQIEPMEHPARELLSRIVPATDKQTRARLYEEELCEVDRVLKELRIIKEQSKKALNYNSKVFIKGNAGKSEDDEVEQVDPRIAEKIAQIDKQFTAKFADTIAFILHYSMSQFIPIHGLDLKLLKDRVENNTIYFKACIDTSAELIEILQQARARIISRQEEEKPQPNIQRLLDQWQQDQQPGRARLWAQQHASIVSQLTAEQQQALSKFSDSFNDLLEKLSQHYVARIETEIKLDGITGKAREYFLCRDSNALQRLLASLQAHRDQQQTLRLLPLIEGNLAELHNDPSAAIIAYQKITDGPAHIDVLTRLFELHTKAEDWDHALDILKMLSALSSTYSPMYADLLYSCGDVDNAVDIYTNFLLENPNDLNSMMKLGKIFQQCGSVEGVSWTMNYILGLDPKNQLARQILSESGIGQAVNSSRS